MRRRMDYVTTILAIKPAVRDMANKNRACPAVLWSLPQTRSACGPWPSEPLETVARQLLKGAIMAL